jgi:hypothetical protein
MILFQSHIPRIASSDVLTEVKDWQGIGEDEVAGCFNLLLNRSLGIAFTL